MTDPIHSPARSRAVIALDEPERILNELLDHMAEHATVVRHAEGARLESPFATVEILQLSDTILVDVMAPTPEILAMVRQFIAEHVFEFAGQEARIDWSGPAAETNLPPQFRQLQVLRAYDLTPHMRRVVFACDRAETYCGDVGYHIRLLLPPAGRVPRWPEQRPDGRLDWPVGQDALISRVYTIREADPAAGTIAVDFVLHEGLASPGADFARGACAGDVVGLMGPGGDGLPPSDNLLLMGDETALPAIARMLAELSPQTRATVIIAITDETSIQPLPTQGRAELCWLLPDAGPYGLERALDERLATGALDATFVWAGCEKSVAARIRKALLSRYPDRKKDFRISAYWQKADG